MTIEELIEFLDNSRREFGNIEVRYFKDDKVLDINPRVLRAVGVDDIPRYEVIVNYEVTVNP